MTAKQSLAAEIRQLGNKPQDADQKLFERFAKCKQSQLQAQVIGEALRFSAVRNGLSRGERTIAAPSEILPPMF